MEIQIQDLDEIPEELLADRMSHLRLAYLQIANIREVLREKEKERLRKDIENACKS